MVSLLVDWPPIMLKPIEYSGCDYYCHLRRDVAFSGGGALLHGFLIRVHVVNSESGRAHIQVDHPVSLCVYNQVFD